MDADKPSINLAQLENEKAKAVWAAEKARRIDENDALNRTQPGDDLGASPTRS